MPWQVLAELGVAVLSLALAGVLLWWASRSRSAGGGACLRCGYPRALDARGPCPECGQPIGARHRRLGLPTRRWRSALVAAIALLGATAAIDAVLRSDCFALVDVEQHAGWSIRSSPGEDGPARACLSATFVGVSTRPALHYLGKPWSLRQAPLSATTIYLSVSERERRGLGSVLRLVASKQGGGWIVAAPATGAGAEVVPAPGSPFTQEDLARWIRASGWCASDGDRADADAIARWWLLPELHAERIFEVGPSQALARPEAPIPIQPLEREMYPRVRIRVAALWMPLLITVRIACAISLLAASVAAARWALWSRRMADA
jgi:hypothetical protein